MIRVELGSHLELVEGRHLVEHARGCLHDRYRQTGPRTFTQAKAEIEQRIETHVGERDGGARFGGPMAGNAVVADPGYERLGGHERGARDDAVDDDGDPRRYGADDEACERGDLQIGRASCRERV